MHQVHQSSAAQWTLPAGKTLHRVAAQARVLRVQSGRVWATRDARLGDLPDDLVLHAGAEVLLARGDGLVLEAFEDSAIEWLEPAR